MEEYLRRSMERHGGSVYRLALCRLRSIPDAEDVCQDVFLRLLQKGDPAWEEERTKAWLLRCTLNRCADVGRWRQRRPAVARQRGGTGGAALLRTRRSVAVAARRQRRLPSLGMVAAVGRPALGPPGGPGWRRTELAPGQAV